MRKRWIVILIIVSAVSLSGCFIDPGEGGTIQYDGNFTGENGSFAMDGEVQLLGPNPPQNNYENISIYLYSNETELLYSRSLGGIENSSTDLPVSISLRTHPKYIIIYSEDLWDGKTQIGYYVRDPRAANGYRYERTTERSQLPVAP